MPGRYYEVQNIKMSKFLYLKSCENNKRCFTKSSLYLLYLTKLKNLSSSQDSQNNLYMQVSLSLHESSPWPTVSTFVTRGKVMTWSVHELVETFPNSWLPGYGAIRLGGGTDHLNDSPKLLWPDRAGVQIFYGLLYITSCCTITS